jgi:hypothetical protein
MFRRYLVLKAFTVQNGHVKKLKKLKMLQHTRRKYQVSRLNKILCWEGVGNRQLLCFFKA